MNKKRVAFWINLGNATVMTLKMQIRRCNDAVKILQRRR